MMCGAPPQSGVLPPGVDLTKETVIAGRVVRFGEAVPGAYVRLLDAGGEFTAEVVTGAEGAFHFFAAPGSWTISVLHRDGSARRQVVAREVGLVETQLQLA